MLKADVIRGVLLRSFHKQLAVVGIGWKPSQLSCCWQLFTCKNRIDSLLKNVFWFLFSLFYSSRIQARRPRKSMSVMETFSSSPFVLKSMSKMTIVSSLAVVKGCSAWTLLSNNCTENQRELSILLFSYSYRVHTACMPLYFVSSVFFSTVVQRPGVFFLVIEIS